MSNVLQAIALALGGGASGVAQGIDDVDKRQTGREQLDLQQRQLYLTQALNQAQLDLHQREFEEQKLRAQQAHDLATTARRDTQIQNFATNANHVGVNFLDPERAYTQMHTLPVSEGMGVESPVSSALNAANSFIGKERTNQAFYKNAETAGNQATHANNPRAFVQGSEPFGGAYAEAKQFSPYGYMAASMRNDSQEARDFTRQMSQARGRIEQAGRAAYAQFARNQGYSDIEKLVQDHPNLQAQADQFALGERKRASQAEIATLQRGFPEQTVGMTAEELMGMPPAAAPRAVPQQQPGATTPHSNATPGLGFDPTDPLGLRTKTQAPAPRQQTPTNAPTQTSIRMRSSSADPLGLFSKP